MSKLILKNVDMWKELNKLNFFSLYDYLFHNVSLNNVSTDIYFAFLELFWPTFITRENYIFLKENFSEEKFEDFKKQKEKIEFWMNFLSLDPFLEEDEEGDERAKALANALVEIWQTKLKKDFPHIEFAVIPLIDTEAGDYGLTFYQMK